MASRPVSRGDDPLHTYRCAPGAKLQPLNASADLDVRSSDPPKPVANDDSASTATSTAVEAAMRASEASDLPRKVPGNGPEGMSMATPGADFEMLVSGLQVGVFDARERPFFSGSSTANADGVCCY